MVDRIREQRFALWLGVALLIAAVILGLGVMIIMWQYALSQSPRVDASVIIEQPRIMYAALGRIL